ncbi:toll/interleukin-1 receptor domain-containing protein [Desulfovibrio sp. Fe33]|uniref:toll/interleukin-1 receptor domain-containing protein n=1 Tax=Desulfovibrio sp. Fe33 TaxID=3020842 RepID=UPI00234D8D10|nr:toll/interleukin-1 receptor domain-containing protein [Desulfovibrio sp. Fe33]
MSWKDKYHLARNLDAVLFTIAEKCSLEGNQEIAEVIRKARVDYTEPYFDDFAGGHLYSFKFNIPQSVYRTIYDRQEEVEKYLSEALSKFSRNDREYVENLSILAYEEYQQPVASKSRTKPIPAVAKSRIWKEGKYRVFLSHKVQYKVQTAKLKAELAAYGIDCFVAHEDIHPTKEWQEEIENALFSMDAFIALMTDNFSDSAWTDQEVGVAYGLQVPMIAIDLGKTPYGFIGKFQALRCSWEEAPKKIVPLLINEEKVLDAYIGVVEKCSSFNEGNTLAQLLPHIEQLSLAQANRLIEAFNANSQVSGSHGFQGEHPDVYGPGLQKTLERITGDKYIKTYSKIEKASS